ncbi:MAG: 2-oxoglutarate dehydrogenase E1 component [Gammaproteobacteria bacterium]|nr:2-oxoglutarate dehydrogenase E1 component [Gammaproteobacteria bacterium]
MKIPQRSMQEQWQDSWLSSGANDAWLESLYETWLKNPSDVAPDWQAYFNKNSSPQDVPHSDVRDFFLQLAQHPQMRQTAAVSGDAYHARQQEKIVDLVTAYRSFGHLQADIDPLGLYQPPRHPALELSWHGFSEADTKITFDATCFAGLKKPTATLGEILAALRDTYCGKIGIEYMHIPNQSEVEWIQQRMENEWRGFVPTHEERLRILDQLVKADGLEKYLGNKYVGQKRFSLEGGDSLMPLIETIVHRGSESGTKEIIIGMAHRGRLNVLVNILGKAPTEIFAVFEGKHAETNYSGDVKYHMGFSSDVKTPYGSIHLALSFNPSHLEIVSPVVQGSVRSRQRRRKDTEHRLVMPIQIHGDAAFAGQGVVMETFSLSQTRWFTVGGSVHIVINNQVGFTTSNPKDSRSSLYCTDIAKMVEAPIIHVNGNDPEAVFFVAKLATDYRHRFGKDIVIDLVCYRRHGHNEADEPSATQPLMYKVIRSMPTPAEMYAKKLISENVIPADLPQKISATYRDQLDAGQCIVERVDSGVAYEYAELWSSFQGTEWTEPVKTSLSAQKLKALAKKLEQLPKGFVVQPQVKKTLEAREKMTQGEMPLNWGYCEILAYASLLDQDYPIRLCGQDACRGTFAHRHSVLYDQNTGESYIPLSHVSESQAKINLIDSLLSEEAVLAFEYGYASAEPNFLTIWEAQFGDFANGAQVVIDQFISSGEQKWHRLCGLVMFLPHGYEGMGPEHSSARLERYLQLCAQNNMQVCVPSTPAQIFHLLRRQMLRPWRKPLIVMTPKSLLRHPLAVSSLQDLSEGAFQLAIPDEEHATKKVDRVVLCCGKIYYELFEKRAETKKDNVALIRIEQLYPFPEGAIKQILSAYRHVKNIIWCQEEPKNQGAWFVMQLWLSACLSDQQTLIYAGRTAAASPAAGYFSTHQQEQEALVVEALG